jgi:hypothetical protein
MNITFIQIISWVALFAIGFFAGLSYSKSKLMPQIKRLKKRLSETDQPIEESENK